MNHFIEYDVNEELEKYCVCIHSGSRNLGKRVFDYWSKIAESTSPNRNDLKEIVKTVKEKNTNKKTLKAEIDSAVEEYKSKKIKGFLDGDDKYRYIVDMVIAQEYAQISHDVMHEQISAIYSKIAKAKETDKISTTHNYIDYDLMIRKGAVRAYEGERLIIPFNMRDGLAICSGKSNKDWNNTAPHGAGRLYSRSKSKEILSVEEFKKTMADNGIYTTSANEFTLDEAPMAYKPYEEIVKLIEPTVDILYFMKPKMNIKSNK